MDKVNVEAEQGKCIAELFTERLEKLYNAAFAETDAFIAKLKD